MSALSIRLDKAMAKLPPPQPAPDVGRSVVGLSEIIAKARADADLLATATPLQRLICCRDRVVRLEAVRNGMSTPTDRPLVEQLRKAQKKCLPGLLDTAQAEVRKAELDLLREAGFTDLNQPGAREHLDDVLFDA